MRRVNHSDPYLALVVTNSFGNVSLHSLACQTCQTIPVSIHRARICFWGGNRAQAPQHQPSHRGKAAAATYLPPTTPIQDNQNTKQGGGQHKSLLLSRKPHDQASTETKTKTPPWCAKKPSQHNMSSRPARVGTLWRSTATNSTSFLGAGGGCSADQRGACDKEKCIHSPFLSRN